MSTEQQILEEVARRVAPAGADVHHLCSSGVGTFSVATQDGDRADSGAYALKVIEETQDDAGRDEREFSALPAIDHPHAVRYRNTGTVQHEGRHYRWLAMDFVDGSSLAQLLADGAVFDQPTALRLLREAVSGTAALWDAGTTHRDLIADNLMITPSGGVVIVDLGLAQQRDGTRRTSSDTAQPPHGIQLGEDWRSDQFALGLLGYRLAAGVEAFARHDGDHASQAERQEPARLAHEVTSAVPQELSRVFERMLAARPQDRYADPAALQTDLERIAGRFGHAADDWVMPPTHGLLCEGDG